MKKLNQITLILAGTLSLMAANVSAGNPPKNGDAPFNSCFGEGKFDGDAYVTFKNANETDAIVCLVNVKTSETVRNMFIGAGKNITMNEIPSGKYYLKVYYGNNWNTEKQNFCGTTGAFEDDERFQKSDQKKDYVVIENTKQSYTIGTITLYGVVDGNMSSTPMSAQDFFTK
ncbi:hypothetical protein FACS1894180_7250 [Bacteroidia bacterium]|nr:hypothetical protein FACS1894178_4610 [Bacteroidia bacterium]GHV45098.1 hypothetical protein FACS1894180_7250 [Bacteroidia bacterium]